MIGVAPMCLPHGTANPISVPRIQDQVHMVWHQAVSPDFHVRLARLLPKKIVVDLLGIVSTHYKTCRTKLFLPSSLMLMEMEGSGSRLHSGPDPHLDRAAKGADNFIGCTRYVATCNGEKAVEALVI
jgi:hypothetical protein